MRSGPFVTKVRFWFGKALPEDSVEDRAASLLEVYTATVGHSLDLPPELLRSMMGSLIDSAFVLVAHIVADEALRNRILGGGMLFEFLRACAAELPHLDDDRVMRVRALAILALRFEGPSSEDEVLLTSLIWGA